jgi:dihydroorotase-like cyclic amidohydrolase
MSEMLIKNGSVVFETETRKTDILVRDGKIAAIFEPDQAPECKGEVIDAKGLYVLPGAIDPHMHLGLYTGWGESYREDSRREAIGGLTTIIDYHRGKGNYLETTADEIRQAEENSIVDFALSLGLCAKKHLAELHDYIKERGITSFKFFFDKQDIAHMFYDIPREEALTLDRADLYEILKQLREISPKLLLCVHCEDPDLFRHFLKKAEAKNPNSTYVGDWDNGRPDFCESQCVAGSMLINGEVGGNMYVVHISAKKSLEIYNTLEKSGIPVGRVTLETCPQYLVLNRDCKANLSAKVNPPLRAEADSEALWEGIRNGSVKTIGTDNVPVSKSKKFEKGEKLWDVWVGFSSPGIAMPCLISEGHLKRGIPLHTIARVLSTNAARIFNLDGKGEIKIGYDADFAIVDMETEREIDESLFFPSDFSIYEGMKFKGWPKYTICRGNILQKDGKILAKPGCGKYLFRKI